MPPERPSPARCSRRPSRAPGASSSTSAGGSDLGLFEVNEAAEIIHGVAHPDANIIFGSVIDDTMDEEVRVTVIAAGFERWEAQSRSSGAAVESIGREEARSRVLGSRDGPRGHLRRPGRRRARPGRRRLRRPLVPSLNRASAAVPLVGAIHAAWSDASAGDLRPAGRGDRRRGSARLGHGPIIGPPPGATGPLDGAGPRLEGAGGRRGGWRPPPPGRAERAGGVCRAR